MDFYTTVPVRISQGVCAACSEAGGLPESGTTPLSSPSASNSPIKQKRKLSSPTEDADQHEAGEQDMEQTDVYTQKLDALPASGLPMTDIMMKEMILTLRGAIQQDIANVTCSTHRELTALGDRVNYVENKMGDFSEAHNELMDAHMDLANELKALCLKVTDLEDRSHRNNMKFRGISELVKPAELRTFLQQLMTKDMPSFTPADVIIDRAHRLHKPPHLPARVPRDVIARIQFFRQNNTLPDPYARIAIYADLSQAIMKARNNLIPITKMLRNHKILYRWGFPVKLMLEKGNEWYTISSLEKGLELLRKWGLLPRDAYLETSRSGPNTYHSSREKHDG